jgi:hypothetical protein
MARAAAAGTFGSWRSRRSGFQFSSIPVSASVPRSATASTARPADKACDVVYVRQRCRRQLIDNVIGASPEHTGGGAGRGWIIGPGGRLGYAQAHRGASRLAAACAAARGIGLRCSLDPEEIGADLHHSVSPDIAGLLRVGTRREGESACDCGKRCQNVDHGISLLPGNLICGRDGSRERPRSPGLAVLATAAGLLVSLIAAIPLRDLQLTQPTQGRPRNLQ